uniref:WGS project CAEQ00000000 data, annotated contig 2186 n=1 Tax=Trypanosoma congolense (strain IL3000) TaxID=1068625 RepID=F9WC51_TRYCI|nr:unnamed protein product [Trypanosoma congolense IL3000]
MCSSTVFALDMSHQSPSLSNAVEILQVLALSYMIPTTGTRMGLVISGAPSECSASSQHSSGYRKHRVFEHISSLCRPSIFDFLEELRETQREHRQTHSEWLATGFIDSLLVCSDLFRLLGSGGKRRNVLYLITDARTKVARMESIGEVRKCFSKQNITLLVVGVDFKFFGDGCAGSWKNGYDGVKTEPIADDEEDVREKNQLALRDLCNELNNGSKVISLSEALETSRQPKCKRVNHCPKTMIFSIGNIQLATHISLGAKREVFKAASKEAGNKRSPSETKESRTEMLRDKPRGRKPKRARGTDVACGGVSENVNDHGSTTLPDVIEGSEHQGIDVIACVPKKKFPVHVLMEEAAHLVTPLPTDECGAKAFRSIVRAMGSEGLSLVVRYGLRRGGNVAIGLCVPLSSAQQDVLVLVRLPFRSEIRPLCFPGREQVEPFLDSGGVNAAEQGRLISSIVQGLTVEKEVLRPDKTFNPFLQQCYATQRAKLNQRYTRCFENTQGLSGDVEVCLPLLPEIKRSSTAFGYPGNILERLFVDVREQLDACRGAFGYVSCWQNQKSFDLKGQCNILSQEECVIDSKVEKQEFSDDDPALPTLSSHRLGGTPSNAVFSECVESPNGLV